MPEPELRWEHAACRDPTRRGILGPEVTLVARSVLSLAVLLGCGFGCAPLAPVLPSPNTDPSPDRQHLWTVEVHSVDDAAQAEEAASAARLRFDEPVTVEHIGGTYHVRVGRFKTEDEAGAFSDVARERGYRGAHAVSTPESPAES